MVTDLRPSTSRSFYFLYSNRHHGILTSDSPDSASCPGVLPILSSQSGSWTRSRTSGLLLHGILASDPPDPVSFPDFLHRHNFDTMSGQGPEYPFMWVFSDTHSNGITGTVPGLSSMEQAELVSARTFLPEVEQLSTLAFISGFGHGLE